MRPWHTWTAFGLCSALVIAAMTWTSWTVLDLERTVREQALVEETVRLALWRLDSSLAPLLAQENSRPYFAYSSFYPAESAYTRMFATIRKGEVRVPSPLLTQPSSHILLHFQIDPDGKLSSPQVPTGNMRDLAEASYTSHEMIELAARRLGELEAILAGQDLLLSVELKKDHTVTSVIPSPREPEQPDQLGQVAQESQQSIVQKLRSAKEWKARAQSYRQAEALGKAANVVVQVPAGVTAEAMVSVWIDEALLLVRRVAVEGRTYLQGCWLDWPGLGDELLASIRDLLPEARLEPTTTEAADDGERRLAALPVGLVPGAVPDEVAPLLSPIRFSLITSWGCVLLAAIAVGALLRGVMSLSERRRVFVSAVTHELRTPLTTFRMYSDMLAEGMVRGEEKRRDYLERLRGEAERLGHLVENVLFYARLEGGRAGACAEKVSLEGCLSRLEERLRESTERAGMRLSVEIDEDGPPLEARMDASVVEQILVNLVDNACKYASGASERLIHIKLERAGPNARVRVRDDGPGISRSDRRRLFRPFSKSDREAANSAPGVGLGLALSRRLARALGGDLRLDEGVEDGACFVLTLPLAGG